MRKIFAVLLTACAAFCCTAVDAQSAPRFKVTDQSNVLRPAGTSGLSLDDLPSIDKTRVIDPALLSPTGVRGASGKGFTAESGMLPSRGVTSAAAAATPFGPPCQITCTGTAEAEACGSDTNGGCTLDFCTTPGFETIASGATVCGTVFADMATRDLDYYAPAPAAAPSIIDINFSSEFEGQVFLIEAGAAGVECSGSVVLATDFSDGCSTVNINQAIGTGQYFVAVTTGNAAGPIFDGVTCAAGDNEYSLEVSVLSADCLTCVGITETDPCGVDPALDTNNGCNFATGPPFPFAGPITVTGATTTFCGNSSTGIDPVTMGMTRDTDWWELDIPAGPQDVTITFTSEFAGVMFLLNDTLADCTALLQLEEAFSGGCNSVTVTAQADGSSGRYLLFVSTGDAAGGIFDGVPCGSTNDYQIDISAAPAACPTPCALTCTGVDETSLNMPGIVGEPCPINPFDPDNFNGGCNADPLVPNAFSPVAVGDTICGTTWADSGTRDTDWYKFTVFGGQTIDITINSSIPVDYFVLGEVDGAGGALANPCDLAATGITVDLVGNHLGDCVPVVETGISLSVDPGIGQRDYVIFVSPADANGALFSGFPCICDFGYSIEVGASTVVNCDFPTGLFTSDCVTGDITFTGTASSDYDAGGVDIAYDDGAGNMGSFNIAGPFTAGDPVVGTINLPAGVYAFDITGMCTAGGDFAAVAALGHHPYAGETDIIFDGDPGGCTDSTAALAAALTANGRTVVVVDNAFTLVSDYACAGSAETLWVALGSFPNAFALTAAEGLALNAAVLTNAQSVYVEGGDVWGFDVPTAFFEVDGVEGVELDGNVILDGDDTLTMMAGAAGTLIDTSALGAAYNQDNLNATQFNGDDFTDQLIVSSGTDSPAGSVHEAIFTESGLGYGVAIASAEMSGLTGNVISSSFEFGGYAGDQNALMGAYLGHLKEIVGGDVFDRGDCNNDNSFNIADAVSALALLFPPPGMPPGVADCTDACDANDDGNFNIADAVFKLSILFPPMGMPPGMIPAPNGVCGLDPTADGLDCLNYNDAMNCP